MISLLMLAAVLSCPVCLTAQDRFPFNPYFLPVVFDGKISDDFSVTLPEDSIRKEPALRQAFKLPEPPFDPEKAVNRLRRMAYRSFLKNNMRAVKYTLSDFPGEVEKVEKIKPNIFQHIFAIEIETEKGDIDRSARFIPKRQYWSRSGNSLLQFSQNYISKNWYDGGVGNLNLLSVQNYTSSYKKGIVRFNNFVEWKLSFYTNSNDTVRNFRLGEDLIRTYTDFGLKAFNDKWSYSSNLEVKTKLLRNYKENSDEYISSIFSPLQINMGIFGMKYQLQKTSPNDKYKKCNLSIDLSLLSLQYTWLADKTIDPIRYGIKEGENSLLDLGSTLNAKIIVHFNRQVTFTSRLKYFTNYEKVILESENELNLPINRYFSTRLYVYGRFDDSKGLKRDPDLKYFQLNELLSFGFNYKF
ncbi:MAG: DUF3078 domain-containing protein [Dysgonamonadaceae bacterium]|nr:DUF3078 domain-containing protein [Dysgonamonadaceae bacterium]